MERIEVEAPLDLLQIHTHPVLEDLRAFYKAAQEASLFPADYELYQQKDGRVAMIDFDKFATWNPDGTVRFPWGLALAKEDVSRAIPFPYTL